MNFSGTIAILTHLLAIDNKCHWLKILGHAMFTPLCALPAFVNYKLKCLSSFLWQNVRNQRARGIVVVGKNFFFENLGL